MPNGETFDFDLEDGKPVVLGTGSAGKTFRGWVGSREEGRSRGGTVKRTPAALKEVRYASDNAGYSLKREVMLMAATKAAGHPCLVRFLSFFYYGRMPIIATELIPGLTLGKTIEECIARGQMDSEEWVLKAAKWGEQLASALECLQQLKIIHRDIKPSNVVIREQDGVPVLIDFGVGRNEIIREVDGTTTRHFVGSKAFASPEQFCTGPATCAACRETPCGLSASADVYALGATLWYTFTGRFLFEEELRDALDYSGLVQAKRAGPSDSDLAALPPIASLRDLLKNMLSGTPSSRPSASKVRKDLEAILGQGATPRPELAVAILPVVQQRIAESQLHALPDFQSIGERKEIAATLLPNYAADLWSDLEADKIDFDHFAEQPARMTFDEACKLIETINDDVENYADAWHYRLPTIAEWKIATGFRPDDTSTQRSRARQRLEDTHLGNYEWTDETTAGTYRKTRTVCFLDDGAWRTDQRDCTWPKGVLRLLREPRAKLTPGKLG